MLNRMSLLISVVLGVLIWFSPHPEDLSPRAWQLFALFVPTILAVITKAMPIGAICMVSASLCVLTHTLTINEALSGFSHPVIWLVALAFFIARSFIKTGLGNRIAYLFVYFFGQRSLSLAYGLTLGDLFLAPAIPSNTARAGGILFPIVKSLAAVFGSSPETKTEKKIGSFLMLSVFHCNVVTSAMFLTSMAANPLVANIAALSGVNISWGGWALAAVVPGICSLALTPYLVFKLVRPEIKETPGAREFSRSQLEKLGPLSKNEVALLGVFVFLLTGWIAPSLVGGASSTTVALAGLAILLLLEVLSWDDIKRETGAWDTLVWFSVLVTYANFLDKLGFISLFASNLGFFSEAVSWQVGVLLLILSYFLIHYLFASSTAHVSALYGTFLVLGVKLGAPALPLALMLGFVSNLYGGLTHYSIGHAPIFFGAGFVDIKQWWKLGILVSGTNLLIWIFLGSLWMGLIGYF